MQFRSTGLLLPGAMAIPAPGTAQTTPAPPAITRTVVAATKLPSVTDRPLHFKAVSITLQPDERSCVSAADGILYQMSGSTEVALDGTAPAAVRELYRTVNPIPDLEQAVMISVSRESYSRRECPPTRRTIGQALSRRRAERSPPAERRSKNRQSVRTSYERYRLVPIL